MTAARDCPSLAWLSTWAGAERKVERSTLMFAALKKGNRTRKNVNLFFSLKASLQ